MSHIWPENIQIAAAKKLTNLREAMNEEQSTEEKIRVFIDMWGSRPWMIMLGESSHLLSNVGAFLCGLDWAIAFQQKGMEEFLHFLITFRRRLSKHLTGNDGDFWEVELLRRNGGDQKLAFQEFIYHLKNLAQETLKLTDDPDQFKNETPEDRAKNAMPPRGMD